MATGDLEKKNHRAVKAKDPETPDVPASDELGFEIGVEGNLPFAAPFDNGLTQKEKEKLQLREILKGWEEEEGPTISQLVAMRRMDGQARALYRLLTLPLRAALAKSTFIPAEGGEEEAEFITSVFTLPPSQGGMSVTFSRFMSQLLQALFDGFAPFEQVYWMPTFGPLKGKYTLRKLAYRQPNTITAVEDKDGHFQGFRQRAYVNGESIDVHIPKDRCFYYAAQEEEKKYYGVSFFQSAFYHYDKKIKMYYIAHLAAQRSAVGTRVGTFPLSATKNAKVEMARHLSNLAVAQWMMIPEGHKVEMLNDSGNFQFLDYINHHNSQMSKSVLANFFDKDTGGGSGDAKLVSFGAPGDDMFVLMLRAIMDEIATAINHYVIPNLIDWNFDSGKYPTFQWAALTDEQKALVGQTFEQLATAGEGANVSDEFLREIEKKMADEMGLEIDWEEVEAREEEEKLASNAVQGLDENGMPLPKDAMGNPIQPGQEMSEASQFAALDSALAKAGTEGAPAEPVPNPAPGEAPLDVEATADILDAEDPKKSKKLKLSQDDQILNLAEEILSLANPNPTSDDYRVVRTQEGAERFGVAIGQRIPNGAGRGEEGGDRKVTVERLISLKSQFEEFYRAGNQAQAKKALLALREAVYDYSGSWSPDKFVSIMKNLGKKSNTPTRVPTDT